MSILLLICYDLRFPVWSRNRNNEYDMVVYVANWPAARRRVWDVMLQTRAMENSSYLCGVNRIGMDGNNLFYNGVSQMMRDSSTGKGILLLHDFQNSFIYGSSDVFNAMIASGVLELGEGSYWNVSNITFIGEIDTTNVEELFPKERDFLTDWQNGQFASPVLNVVQSQISNDNTITIDEKGNKIPNVGFVRFVTNQIRNRFLSSYCAEAFQRKIFMNDMGSKEIYEALCSPHSALNLYKNDLDDDYMHSDAFIQKVVYQIMESGEGLHYVTTAVEDVLSHDVKQNKKVLKKGSLLGSHKK